MEEPLEEMKLQTALKECWTLWRAQSVRDGRRRVRMHEPTYGTEEIWAVVKCLLSTQVTMGEAVGRFEEEFAARFGFKHAVMTTSGSSANLLAIAALSHSETLDPLRPGDEVIVPALSWPTTVWPLAQYGLIPVVVDINPDTLNLDPDEVEEAIGPRTRAIFPVHASGNPCDLGVLARIAREKSLVLLEDCRQALGARYAGKSVGRFSRVATYSFHDSHHISTIEGGMCATDDFELSEVLRSLRAYGEVRENIDPGRHWRAHPGIDPASLFVSAGYNLRPMELQAAIGSVQLPKLDGFLSTRSENAAWFLKECEPWRELLEVQEETPGGQSVWFEFPMGVRNAAPFTCRELRAHLELRGVDTRLIMCGNIALQPGLKAYPHRVVGDLVHANHVANAGFAFGIHQNMDDLAREHIAHRLREFVTR